MAKNRIKELANGPASTHQGARRQLLNQLYPHDSGKYHPVPWVYYTRLTIESAAVLAALINLGGITARKKDKCQEGLHVRRSADGKLWFWCSVYRVCKRFNISKKVEGRIIKNLVDAELIEKQVVGYGNNRRRYIHINTKRLNDMISESL